MLRTHKLGEADRIITLLTRQHGGCARWPRACAARRRGSGSRLEPFTHVDLQLAEGRNLDIITQAETLDPFHARLGADYDRYTAGTRDARDRRAAGHRGARSPRSSSSCCSSAGCGRWPRASTARRAGARLLPAALAVGRRLRAVVRPLRAAAASRGRTGAFNPSAGGVAVRRPAGSRARPARPRETIAAARCAARRRLAGRGRGRPAPPARRPAGWSRRTSPGTSSAACARWRTSSGGSVDRAPARGASGPRGPECAGSPSGRCARRPRTPPVPRRPRCPPVWSPPRRDHHGRQRPLGQGARAAAHRGPRARRALAVRRRRGRDRDRREGDLGLRLLHRELVALARRGASS